MNKNISDLKLEQWLLGELSADEANSIQAAMTNDPTLQARVESLKEQNKNFFKSYPPEQFQADLKQKLHLRNSQEQYNSDRSSSGLFGWRVLAGALAACILLFVVIPSDSPVDPSTTSHGNNTIRTKGEASYLIAHLVEGDKQTPLMNGATVKAGDRIQLSINQAKGRSFVVFSLDGNGVISHHYPIDQQTTIQQINFFSLPTSYRLDDAPAFEAFYLVASEQRLNKDNIIGSIEQAQATNDFQKAFLRLLPAHAKLQLLTLTKAKNQ